MDNLNRTALKLLESSGVEVTEEVGLDYRVYSFKGIGFFKPKKEERAVFLAFLNTAARKAQKSTLELARGLGFTKIYGDHIGMRVTSLEKLAKICRVPRWDSLFSKRTQEATQRKDPQPRQSRTVTQEPPPKQSEGKMVHVEESLFRRLVQGLVGEQGTSLLEQLNTSTLEAIAKDLIL